VRAEDTVRANVSEIVSPPGEDYFAFPLSLQQAAMWPRDLPCSSDPRLNGAFRMSLAGKVDAALLERSFREIAQRHEIFRATFRIVDAEVQQVIFPSSDLTLDTLDLRAFHGDERASKLDEMCLREAQRGFDLTKGTPIRARLLRVEDEHFILTLTIYQIICDGWSIGLLMEELAEIYSAFAKGQPSPLPRIDFQYGDYVLWQRESSLHADAQSQLEYWKKKLAGCRQIRVTPDVATTPVISHSDIVSQLLPRDLTDRLRNLSQAQNATFFVATMAACMVLLNRWTGEKDIALRTPLAGRSRVEFEGIIGQFVNHVVIRCEVSGDLTITDLVARVRESVWEALANQDAPFEQVVQEIAGPNSSSDGLFGVNFVCQREYGRNGPFQFEFDGIRMTTLPSKSQGALYDLNFFLVEREVGWRLSLEYKTGFYSQSTAENLLRHFQEILQEIVADPERRLSELSLPMEALERRMELNLDSSEPADTLNEEGLASMEMQAMPCSFAQERFWTLSQVDPSDTTFHIPLTMRLMGKLSVPLLEKSFKLLINRHETLRTSFSEMNGELMQVISDDYTFMLETMTLEGVVDEERTSSLSAVVQEEVARPFDLSSLPLFRALLCRIASQEHVLIITIHHILADAWSVQVFQRELWTAYESLQLGKEFSFAPLALQYGDFSVWQREMVDSEAMAGHLDFWLKALSGDLPVLNFPTDHAPSYQRTSQGAVETLLLSDDLSRSLKQFAQSSDVTLFVVTLACFALLLARASDAQDIIVGSPVVNRKIETEPLIGPFAGPVALRLNLSDDPTLRDFILTARDTTLEALGHAELPFEVLLERLKVWPTAGRSPLFQFYFFCQPAFFQSRELPELTITPFPSMSVGTPFEMQLGVIERAEGMRAELEYNSTLFERTTGEEWLQYYQTLLMTLVSTPDLRVSELPQPPRVGPRVSSAQRVTPGSGPVPAGCSIANNTTYINDSNQQATPMGGASLPPTEEERKLTKIWSEILGIDSIDRNDNFFDLGGHSLLLIRLFSRINKEFQSALPITTIFDTRTLSGLAKLLIERARISSLVPVQRSGSKPPLFMVHSYLLYHALSSTLGHDQPFYGLRELPEDENSSIEEMAVRYIADMRSVQRHGPYCIAGWCAAGPLAVEIARRLILAGEEVALLVLFDSWLPGYAKSVEAAENKSPARALTSKFVSYKARLHGLSLRERFQHFWKILRRTSKEARDEIYIKHWSSLLGLSKRLNISLPQFMHNTTFQTYAAIRKFRLDASQLRITLIRASESQQITGASVSCGWERIAKLGVDVLWVPGDHETMFQGSNLEITAKLVKQSIANVRQRKRSGSFKRAPDPQPQLTTSQPLNL